MDFVGSQGRIKKIPETVLARTCLEASVRLANLQPTLSLQSKLYFPSLNEPAEKKSIHSLHDHGDSTTTAVEGDRFLSPPSSLLDKSPNRVMKLWQLAFALTAVTTTTPHLLFGCGQASSRLAQARLNWGARVHESVIGPMKRIADATGPNSEMARARRQAWRAGGELRSVSERAARASTSAVSSQGTLNEEAQSPNGSDGNWHQLPLSANLSTPMNSPSQGDGNSAESSQSGRSILRSAPIPISQSSHQSPPVTASSKETVSPGGVTAVTPNGDGSFIRTAKATQLNAIKEDLEAESQLFKEKALRELFNFETISTLEFSQALVEMVEISAAYHRTCAAILEELAPLLRAELDEQCPLPVYGRSLESHLAVTHAKIAYPLRQCIRALNNPTALCEEGIFRIAGSKTKVDTLKSALNSLRAGTVISQYDPYVVADAMKQYLRSLPQPLLTSHLLGEWTRALEIKDKAVQLRRLRQIAHRMPPEYERNAGYLFRFLHRFTEYSVRNRMTPAGLAIIFGPSLLAPPVPAVSPSSSASTSADGPPTTASVDSNCGGHQNETVPAQLAIQGTYKGLIELLIVHANEIFPLHPDDEEDEAEVNFDVIDNISLTSEPTSSTSVRPFTPSDLLSRRAQRAMTEFARQSRAIRTLPQRLRAKHWKVVNTTSTASTLASTNPIPVSAPVGRSLTPIPVRKVADLDLDRTSRLDRTRSLTQEEIPVMVKEEEVAATRAKSPQLRQPLRSALQRQHMEWRRAMLEVTEDDGDGGEGGEEQKSSIHGDLYDTLFTLQTLNSKSGVEELLARVRSVYEARSVMGKSTLTSQTDSSDTAGAREKKAGKGGLYMIRRHSTSSLSMLEHNRPRLNNIVATTATTQMTQSSKVANHRKKCCTTPDPLNGRTLHRFTMPLFTTMDIEGKRRPFSTLSRFQRFPVSETEGGVSSNMDSTTSMVALLTTADVENCRWRCEPLTRPSKGTPLPRAGVVDLSSVSDRRKVVSANVSTANYPATSLEGKA
ncbi:Rho GTPase-activating protein RICH2 [Echinococcus granulosus]|uniref:Rho GTPase-activating protein RICH2 n=1 Tax=Echinococcus granulosus TaxID=6210 RepID=W6U9B4_ECHGR|nr:Rho GTPase-activating protein RICH2 [Echinococcus granulosus]EUB57610.1 Rho GTPase-activating protein RICH2 [Echinococcus granulosus]